MPVESVGVDRAALAVAKASPYEPSVAFWGAGALRGGRGRLVVGLVVGVGQQSAAERDADGQGQEDRHEGGDVLTERDHVRPWR